MDADLTATPTFDSNGAVTSWQLCYTSSSTAAPASTQCGDGKSSAPYPKLDFAKGTGGHNIKIDIANGNGIVFAQTNPVWIQQNSKPTGPTVDAQISQITGAGSTTLKFHDKNSEAMLLKYQLNFQGGTGLMAIDPDITNGGRPIYTSESFLIVAAVALALLLLVVWRVNVGRRATRSSGTGSE